MNDTTLSPSDLAALAERGPRFFRGLVFAFLAVALFALAVLAAAGCASTPELPPGAYAFATNVAQRVSVALREASSHSQADEGQPESELPAPSDPPRDEPDGAAGAAEEEPAAAAPSSSDQGSPECEAPSSPAPSSPVLVFRYGGFDGSKASEDPATQIRAFKVSSSGMSYAWAKGDLGNWGLATTDAGALACAFYWSDKENAWIGGKFEWISTSRTTRDWKNVRERYNGWDPDAFFSASRHAFCIVSKDGRKRTNLAEGGK